MSKFSKISEIDKNYNNKLFLTFDIDWCSDEILIYLLDILEEYGVKATFFVTHKTSLLEKMRANLDIELGIHPNFNPLLNGSFQYGKNATEVISYYKRIVPESISIRSHSLSHNGTFSSIYENQGLKYDCNTYIPYYSQIKLSPWLDTNENVLKIPHFFADDGVLFQKTGLKSLSSIINKDGLKVLDFHPIHIFLNSENLERYNNARPYLNNYDELKKHINKTAYGVKDLFIDIIEEVLNND
jgi:hypothetical protein